MAQTFVPIARYRVNQVTNGGTTVQVVGSNRNASQTETIQADIAGQVSFNVKIPGSLPVPIPPIFPLNPHTT